jgi:parallel beta-helix repeat protein
VSNSGDDGIELYEQSSNNVLDNNNVFDNAYGIFIDYFCNNNILTNNNVSNNSNQGIEIYYSNNNILKSNVICNNNKSGIQFSYSDNNTIFNNFFNNTNNTRIDTSSTGNIWNVTKALGPNIVNGPYVGGNYWAHPNGTGHSQTCNDTNLDGFCDSQFDIDANNTDYLPLTLVEQETEPVIHPQPNFDVPTINPLLLIGMLGFAVVFVLKRKED